MFTALAITLSILSAVAFMLTGMCAEREEEGRTATGLILGVVLAVLAALACHAIGGLPE